MSEKWTKGPWSVRQSAKKVDGAWDYGIGAEIDGRQQCIAETFGRSGENSFPPSDANARLIAAAPDLYEAALVCRQHLALFCGPDDAIANEIFRVVDAALSKARGGSDG